MADIREQARDKKFLQSIVENAYHLPKDVDAFAFSITLIENFASTDSELRDELSYMILANAIIDKQKLTAEQLEKLLNIVMDDRHLFYGIGEIDTDTVFMRSFSTLIIAAILYSDARKPELSMEVIDRTKSALLDYAQKEQDWRGYVDGKGWVHAMAHLADALDECAQNRKMDEQDRKEILDALSELARLSEPLYAEEDIRLATVAYHIILGKEVDDEALSNWVDSCYVEREADVTSWTRGTNVKNFLRSLYFLLHWDGAAPVLTEHISRVLKKQDEVYLESRGTD